METETSYARPLPFGVLELDALGPLGHCSCPGSKILDAQKGPQLRDLNADLQQLSGAGFRAFIGLLTADEYQALQLSPAELARACARQGMEFLHLPEFENGAPAPGFEENWLHVGARLRYLLKRGEGVVIQGQGNRERRRYVIARGLIEMGQSSDALLKLFQTQGLGAFGNAEVEAELRRYARQLRLGPDLHERDRRLGALVLGALGDSLGSLVQFDRRERIEERFGPRGLRLDALLDAAASHIGDETQMTLFSAEALAEVLDEKEHPSRAEIVKTVKLGLRRWRMSQEAGPAAARGRSGLLGQPALWVSRKPNHSCLSALEAHGPAPFNPEQRQDDPGAITRIAPLALVAARWGHAVHVFDRALALADITHKDPLACWPAAIQAVLLAELIAGRSPEEARQVALDCMPNGEEARQVAKQIEASRLIEDASGLVPEILEELSAGETAADVLLLALACSEATTDPVTALEAAVNHGGKSDAIATITGQLIGARQGLGVLPARLYQALELKQLVVDCGMALDRHARWRPDEKEKDELRAFLPFFENPPEEIVRKVDGEIVELVDEFTDFEEWIYRQGFIVHRNEKAASAMAALVRAEPELVAMADADSLGQILQAFLREERASLENLIREGHFAKVIARLTER